MDLPVELRQTVSSPGEGTIALVIGVGCSAEAPTGVPVAGGKPMLSRGPLASS